MPGAPSYHQSENIGHLRLGALFEACCVNAYDATWTKQGYKLPDGPVINIENINSSIFLQYRRGLHRAISQSRSGPGIKIQQRPMCVCVSNHQDGSFRVDHGSHN